MPDPTIVSLQKEIGRLNRSMQRLAPLQPIGKPHQYPKEAKDEQRAAGDSQSSDDAKRKTRRRK